LAATNLAGGADEDLSGLTPADYQKGLKVLASTDGVNLLCIPDAVGERMKPPDTQAIQAAMISHCEFKADRFAILDPRPDHDIEKIKEQRANVNSDRGFAALYFPWVLVANPGGKGRLEVPPSGHIAGVYAKNDDTRGVHKAPANESITSALALPVVLTDAEQGPANEAGINVIRSFPGRGIKIWGARTIAPHDITQWRYVNVRRLLLFIEKSIQEGTRFAVFEPNNLALWGRLRRLVNDFLTGIWRDGGLFGATPEKAFRVRVDEDLNPSPVRALGQVIVEVILFPTTPAEFVVFRIIQEPGGSFVKESAQ
jgi:phage tail sheath protein FI